MLKLIYKSILVTVLSINLMMLDVQRGHLVMSQVQAETLKTDGVKDSNLMASLTMTGVGILTSRLYKCTLTTDMMIAAAGGAAFVAGEILSTFKLKSVYKDIETDIERMDKGDITDKQRQILIKLRQSYEEAKKTANTKKMLQMAAAAAFAAAAVSAYMLNTKEIAAFAKCKSAVAESGASCPTVSGPSSALGTMIMNLETQRYMFQPSAAGKAKETVNLSQEKTGETAIASAGASGAATFSASCSSSGSGCNYIGPCSAAGPKVSGACMPITPTLLTTSGYCPAGVTAVDAGTSLYEQYKFAMTPSNPMMFLSTFIASTFAPNAHADLFSPMGIASSAAIAFLMYKFETLGPTIDSYLLAPMNRAIIWGVLGGLAYAASSAMDNVIGILDSNIAKIDGILNEINSMDTGAGGTNGKPSPVATNPAPVPNAPKPFNIAPTTYDDIDMSGDGGVTLPCFTGSDAKNCKSFTELNKNLPSFKGMDPETQKQINDILGKADAFNGKSKVSGSSLKGAEGLANSNNAIRKALDNAKSKLQAQLKTQKSKKDLAKDEQALRDKLNGITANALKKAGSNPSQMMGSIYGGGFASTSVGQKAEGEASLVAGASDGSEKLNALAAGTYDLSGSAAGGDDSMSLFGDDSKGSQYAMGADGSASKLFEERTGTTMDDYELSQITKDSSTSLFDVISNRYQKSGYSRLFKLKTDEAKK